MPTNNQKLRTAKALMDSFSERTGLTGSRKKQKRRYLWTDAFAVQTFFGLSHGLDDESYKQRALDLIELVHEHLGRHHPEDERTGWISGLPEEEGKERPTAGGLRIGKELPERKEGEPFNERLEWNRDGQYFHYLTRWFNALLLAWRESEDPDADFLKQAEDLLVAGTNFISRDGPLRMYWKMSTDLKRPLVRSMGAHDPLEGLVCTLSLKATDFDLPPELESAEMDFRQLCAGQDWRTTDSLGIGGLLLNTAKVFRLSSQNINLAPSIQPEKLLQESLSSLSAFVSTYDPRMSASRRLAFRECGLSLGIRTLAGTAAVPEDLTSSIRKLDEYLPLADELENFWSQADNQETSTWKDHLDINAVTLASSLTATSYPTAFSGG